MLFNEPKLLKAAVPPVATAPAAVSVLFNEPKLLKPFRRFLMRGDGTSFSALQRAEIAEIRPSLPALPVSQILIPARRRS